MTKTSGIYRTENIERRILGYLNSFLCWTLIGFITVIDVSSAGFIEWKLLTRPVMMGMNVSMMCTITADSEPAHMAWRKIPKGQAIAYNKAAINSTKYEVRMNYDDASMIYYLIIKDFNLDDVNHIYRCESEFLKDSGNVSLEYFIAMPSRDEITDKFIIANGMLNGSVIIPHVYPKPVCDVKFQEQNITAFTAMKSYRPVSESVFYTSNINLLFKTSDCSGIVNMSCSVGIQSLILTKKLKCTDEKFTSTRYLGLGIVAVILTTLLISGIIACKLPSLGKLCSGKHTDSVKNEEVDNALL